MLRRILEILTYLATNHSAVANILFHFDPSVVPECPNLRCSAIKNDKGKEKIVEGGDLASPLGNFQTRDVPLILFLKLLSQPLFLRSSAHLEQVQASSSVMRNHKCATAFWNCIPGLLYYIILYYIAFIKLIGYD